MHVRAFDLGITHFDLANNYGTPPGNAEIICGQIIRDMPRDELVISSKAGYLMWPGPYGEWGSRKHLISSCDQSLKRMGLEYFDIFYHHRPDPNTPVEESMGALETLVRQGKALYAGVSSYNGRSSLKPPGRWTATTGRRSRFISLITTCWGERSNGICCRKQQHREPA